MMEKLLLLGIDTATRYILEYTKKINVFTIITDFQEPQNAPLKLMADDYWMIDLDDLDQLEPKCRETGVTAVMAGNHEYCLDQAKALCHRLGLPFFASDETWRIVRNKGLIKEAFQNAGLDVPQRYQIDETFSEDALKTVRYPVIVKPSDANGERGLSYCRNEAELIAGYHKALQFSLNKEIIVEQFIEGDELYIAYYADDDTPHTLIICDSLKIKLNGRENISLAAMHSRYYDECFELTNDKIGKLMKNIGVKNGHIAFQAIRSQGRYYFLECGYRLSGGCFWALIQKQIGDSYLEWMVQLALGRKPDINWDQIDTEEISRNCLVYLYWANSGKVDKILGVDLVRSEPDILLSFERFKEGAEIPMTEDFSQIAWFIQMLGATKEELVDHLRLVNDHLKLLDSSGQSLMIPFEDYDMLLNLY